MKNEWVIVTKETFQDFNKKNALAVVNHRKDFKFYGNASHSGLSKMNFKTKEYYIISSRMEETQINKDQEQLFNFEIEVKNLENNKTFIIKDSSWGINEIEAYKTMCIENTEAGFETITAKCIS